MALDQRSPLKLYDYDVMADGQGGNLKDCVMAADGTVPVRNRCCEGAATVGAAHSSRRGWFDHPSPDLTPG